MKIQELRIGNIVNIGVVADIGRHMGVDYVRIEDKFIAIYVNSNGVPLNAKWLQRFGFNKTKDGCYSRENYNIKGVKFYWYLFNESGHVIAHPFRFVHELMAYNVTQLPAEGDLITINFQLCTKIH